MKTFVYFLVLMVLLAHGGILKNPGIVMGIFFINWSLGYFARYEQEEKRDRRFLKLLEFHDRMNRFKQLEEDKTNSF